MAGDEGRIDTCGGLVELAGVVGRSGALAEGSQLDDGVEDFGVDLSFAREQTCFAQVVIVAEEADSVHGHRAGDVAVEEIVGDGVGGVVEIGVVADDVLGDMSVLR